MNARLGLHRFLGLGLSALLVAPVAGCEGGDMSGELAPDPIEDPSPDPDPMGAQDCSIDTGVPGIDVVLHDSDGKVVSTQAADDEGIATWDLCPPKAMASFVGVSGNKMIGMTLAGFGPDKHYQMRSTQLGVLGAASVDVPDYGDALTKVRVSAGPGCASASAKNTTEQLTLTSACVDTSDNMLPVLAKAELNDSHLYSYSTEAALNMDNMVVDNMSSWTTGPFLSLDAMNVTSEAVLFMSVSLRNGIAYDAETGAVEALGGYANISLPSPPSGFVTSRVMGITIPDTSGYLGIVRHSTEISESFDASLVPPPVSGVAVDDINSARPKITLNGGSPTADMRLTVLGWDAQDQDVIWYVITPGDQPTAALPAMPEAWAGLAPAGVNLAGAALVEVSGESFDSILTAGYTLGSSAQGCPDLAEGAECRFTTYSP